MRIRPRRSRVSRTSGRTCCGRRGSSRPLGRPHWPGPNASRRTVGPRSGWARPATSWGTTTRPRITSRERRHVRPRSDDRSRGGGLLLGLSGRERGLGPVAAGGRAPAAGPRRSGRGGAARGSRQRCPDPDRGLLLDSLCRHARPEPARHAGHPAAGLARGSGPLPPGGQHRGTERGDPRYRRRPDHHRASRPGRHAARRAGEQSRARVREARPGR